MEDMYYLKEINVEYFDRCLQVLEEAQKNFIPTLDFTLENEVYRHALIDSFDKLVVLAYRLLKKRLAPYFATKQSLDALTYKDIFRTAYKHSLISEEEVLHWFTYRYNRFDDTANYGQNLLDKTLPLMPLFIKDARCLQQILTHGKTIHA